ncbi:hypothetical protein [Pedobacter mendelii]|uniref:hypothetical protein n=1 Tax=Pedobacter mendelii TaxID=1908240 RepID=UPI001E521E3E|nr:hypothetical protein [Pedobacter mendelii]
MFPLELNGENHRVLLVNINPGGPGGSATQYFTSDFNGNTFKPDSAKQKWMIFTLIC